MSTKKFLNHKVKKINKFLILFLSINMFAAEEILYCIEKEKVGFEPLENYKQYNYTTKRFTIKVDFEKNSLVSNDISFGTYMSVACTSSDNQMVCDNVLNSTFKLFKGDLKFIMTGILAPDSIYVTHGKCEKF
jgi:hypothetical protein